MGFFDYFNNDLAIDLGTANTLIISKGSVVVDEPSIIAIDRLTNKVLAVGSEAMQMHEKTHENIKTIRPLKDGVIADFHAAEHMIRGLIKMIDSGKRFLPVSHRMVICIPSGFKIIRTIYNNFALCYFIRNIIFFKTLSEFFYIHIRIKSQ